MIKKCPYCGKTWKTPPDLFADTEARYLGQWDFDDKLLWCWCHAAPGCGTTFTLGTDDIRKIFEYYNREENKI